LEAIKDMRDMKKMQAKNLTIKKNYVVNNILRKPAFTPAHPET